MSMKYKLLCVDIDGTLLDDEKRVPIQVKKSLKNAYDRGVKVALASGRMPAGIELIEKELGIPCIKICNAGTYILMGENCIGAEYLSNSAMKDFYRRFALSRDIPLWIFRGKEWYVTGIDKYIEQEIKIIPKKPHMVDVEQLADEWDKDGIKPNKLLVAADVEILQEIYREIRVYNSKELDMARSADTFIEIFPKGASKGRALKTICKELNIDIAETIAIGDQELDIPMIEAAGIGIAMGNAISDLKEKADFVTRTNNEAGIAYALEQFLL